MGGVVGVILSSKAPLLNEAKSARASVEDCHGEIHKPVIDSDFSQFHRFF